jgi:diacylglycerol kinase (ATP)
VPDEPTCVIYNPIAGRGRARKQIELTRKLLAPDAVLMPTTGPGQAVDVAREAVASGFRRIIAAGGDGTVHEVANGLLDAHEPNAVLSVWPLGSMNDYAFTLGLLEWWNLTSRPPLDRMAVDVGLATAGDRKQWFINSAGIGFNGMVSIESRKIRWLRGLPLYAWGLAITMMKHFTTPTLAITVGETIVRGPALMYGIYLGQREGGFPIGKDARLDDGLFDTLYVGDIQRWELVRYLPGLITGNLPTNHPKLHRGRAHDVTITGGQALCCHLDGEFLCRPEDHQTEARFVVVPKRLTVECYRPGLYGQRSTT